MKLLKTVIPLKAENAVNNINNYVFSGAGVIYVINEVDGTLEVAHKLQVSTKNFPGTVKLYSKKVCC